MAIDIGWTGIVSGVDNGDVVENKLTTTFQNIEDELNLLQDAGKHPLILTAVDATNQLPAGLGVANAIKIKFGAGVATADVTVDALGNVTFNNAGTYIINFIAHFGRSGSTGASLLAFRMLLNGVQVNKPQVSKIDNADVLHAWSSSHVVIAGVNDVLHGELMRVDGYDNSGGLYATDIGAWGVSSSAELHIHKVA